MYVFGQNNKGQLGIGDTVERNIPIANAVIDTIKSSYNDFAIAGVSLGDEYSVFYTRNGDVYGYGDYSLGTPVARNETKSYVPVLIGERTELISKYEMTIHVGETATLDTYSGKKFNLITDYANPGSISFESKNTAIADVTAVGDDGEITGNKIGITHIVVKKGNLTSVCIVHVIDKDAQTAPMISAGNSHVIALKSDGTVWTWGNNEYGQLGDGSVSCAYEPINVTALNGKDIVSVHAGEYHSIALTRDGEVYTWGHNDYGQLGLGNASIVVSTPQKVESLPEIVSISAGKQHTMVLGADGYVYSFGDNSLGQLGAPSRIQARDQALRL